MRPSLSVKALLRSPVRTLLTFVLLAVVTFALFSQTAEYAITAREIERAAGRYVGVGSAEIAPPEDTRISSPRYIGADPRVPQSINYSNATRYEPLTREQIDDISALPYVTSTDARYMTAGVSDTLYRLDDGSPFSESYYNYTARCVVEGTLTEVVGGEFDYNFLILEECKLLAGNPPWAIDDEPLRVHAYKFPLEGDERAGYNFGVPRNTALYTENYKYDAEYVNNMTPGGRYVFVFRFEPLTPVKHFFLYDFISEPWCPSIWALDGEPDHYLETEKFAPLRELIELTNADLHTLDVVYTDGTDGILRFARGEMAIVDGRGLTAEDAAAGAKVCVISRDFAAAYALAPGDTVTVGLGTELFEQYKGIGAVAVTRERYKPPETRVTLTVVGLYYDLDGPVRQSMNPNLCYSVNTLFVPKSLLPVDEAALAGHVFSPSEFSFKVENAWDIPAFAGEAGQIFEKMGLDLIFFDDGWSAIARDFHTTRAFALIKITVCAAAAIAATGFTVYLFIMRKKKEYAVMRALGTPRGLSAKALLFPLITVAIASVLAGSSAALIYTVKTIAESNAFARLDMFAVDTSVPAGAAAGCVFGEFLLTLIIAAVMLRRIGAVPPLLLLQGDGNGRRKESPVAPMNAAGVPLAFSPVTRGSGELHTVTAGKSVGAGFVLRYIARHVRRSIRKSALAVVLAALLLAMAGSVAQMRQSYVELCAATDVRANFIGLSIVLFPDIAEKDFVRDAYYEAAVMSEVNYRDTRVVVTNNIDRYTNEDTQIAYAEGYDASAVTQFGEFVIVGKFLAEQYGLEVGDTIPLARRFTLSALQSNSIKQYRMSHPDENITDEEILARSNDDIQLLLRRETYMYTVAGIVTTPSGAYDGMVFTPGSANSTLHFGAGTLDVAEFKLADYRLLDELRKFGERTAGGTQLQGLTFVLDSDKLESLLNTLQLLDALYPVAVAAALLIGGFCCCLVIVQSSKEAAIMRVLGTTKRRTRAMLASEQVLLSVGGLLIGLCGMLIYKGSGLSAVSAPLSRFAAMYFAAIVLAAVFSAAAATRRNILELLQTKE